MESKIRERKIHALEAQWKASWLRCASLAEELKEAKNAEQRALVAPRLDQSIKENRAVHAALILLLEREAGNAG
jgi:hypothetical protein